MEAFWFFRLRSRRAYDSTYDSDFRFSLGRKHSYVSDYDSDSDSVASENQPSIIQKTFVLRPEPFATFFATGRPRGLDWQKGWGR